VCGFGCSGRFVHGTGYSCRWQERLFASLRHRSLRDELDQRKLIASTRARSIDLGSPVFLLKAPSLNRRRFFRGKIAFYAKDISFAVQH
jgi:hypothetical protein